MKKKKTKTKEKKRPKTVSGFIYLIFSIVRIPEMSLYSGAALNSKKTFLHLRYKQKKVSNMLKIVGYSSNLPNTRRSLGDYIIRSVMHAL